MIAALTDACLCCKQCQNLSVKDARRAALSMAQMPQSFIMAKQCGIRAGRLLEISKAKYSAEYARMATLSVLRDDSLDGNFDPERQIAIGSDIPGGGPSL